MCGQLADAVGPFFGVQQPSFSRASQEGSGDGVTADRALSCEFEVSAAGALRVSLFHFATPEAYAAAQPEGDELGLGVDASSFDEEDWEVQARAYADGWGVLVWLQTPQGTQSSSTYKDALAAVLALDLEAVTAGVTFPPNQVGAMPSSTG